MANYNTLISAIQSFIAQNGNNEITGNILQQQLISMINTLGYGFQFMGVAQPSTNPGTPDAKVFYIAYEQGTYVNFDAIEVTGLCVLKYSTSWQRENIIVSGGGNFELEPDDLAFEGEGSARKLKFANRNYNTNAPNGLGYKILRTDANLEAQIVNTDTIYEIRYDYNLNQGTITIPSGCVLRFIGGSITNGTVVLNGTKLEGDIKLYCTMSGTMANNILRSSWNGDVPLSVNNAKTLGCAIYVDIPATLNAPLSLFGMREVIIRSTITNSENNYLEIGYNSSITLPVNIDIWNATYVKMTGGKEIMVTIRNCENFVLEADSDVSTKGSIAYCTFNLGLIRNFSIIGRNNGWINENTFIKGRFINTFIIQGDTYPHNHNVFYNPTFEGELSISLDKCSYNVFRDCRMEGNPAITLGATAANNRFYRSWLENNNSLWRMFYGSKAVRGNGVYFDDSTFVKAFTLDRNSYLNRRNLALVSLCDDALYVRHETASTYARLKITPTTDFGVIMNSDNNGMARMSVTLYDTTGANITDTLTSYLNSLGSFTMVTSPYTYYTLNRDDYYAYLQVSVDNINAYLKTTYGVDANDNPVKQLGYVIVGFNANNVRKVFNFGISGLYFRQMQEITQALTWNSRSHPRRTSHPQLRPSRVPSAGRQFHTHCLTGRSA